MRHVKVLVFLAATALCFQSALAGPVVYDIVDGLYANKPSSDANIVQTGQDNWWYYDHATGGFGSGGPLSAARMTPSNYSLITVGGDGVGESYGYGPMANSRGLIKNGTWGTTYPALLSGSTQGDCIYLVDENFHMMVIEFRAPVAGTYDANFEIAGRLNSDPDMEYHLFKRVGGVSTELVYDRVGTATTSTDPNVLAASGIALDANDSLFIYATPIDSDGYDGSGIRGSITLIPEPASVAALLGVGGIATLLRRRRT